MNINFSYSSNTDVEGKIGLNDTLIEELFGKIVHYILYNDVIKKMAIIPGGPEEDCDELEVDLYLCDDKEIQSLNKQYRGKDSPTDVLSFAIQDDCNITTFPIVHLGEVIISVDKLSEQAQANNHSSLKELAFLISHGVLHLLGLTHDTNDNYERIISLQNEIVDVVTKEFE